MPANDQGMTNPKPRMTKACTDRRRLVITHSAFVIPWSLAGIGHWSLSQPVPQVRETSRKRRHQHWVGRHDQILLVLLAGAAGPVETPGHQPAAVEHGELVVHVGRVPHV